jgi:hypothetical protein
MADPNIQLPSLPAAVSASLTDLLLARQGSVDKKLTVQLLQNLIHNNFSANDILTKLLTVDGSGSNLDADKLDGQEGEFYRNASNLNAGTIPQAQLSASDILTLIKTVDGTGSGLDADALDGQTGAYYTNASNLNAGTVPQARLPIASTSTVGIIEQATQTEVNNGTGGNLAVIASTLRNNVQYSLGNTGYIRFPSWLGGFTVQWGEAANVNEHTFVFPIPFTDVFQSIPTTSRKVKTVAVTALANNQVIVSSDPDSAGTSTLRHITVGIS